MAADTMLGGRWRRRSTIVLVTWAARVLLLLIGEPFVDEPWSGPASVLIGGAMCLLLTGCGWFAVLGAACGLGMRPATVYGVFALVLCMAALIGVLRGPPWVRSLVDPFFACLVGLGLSTYGRDGKVTGVWRRQSREPGEM